MSPRKYLSVVGQLFLVFAFLCAPLADNAHALRMQQAVHAAKTDADKALVPIRQIAENAPCHESMPGSSETSAPETSAARLSNDKEPCCPIKQCSPDNCLIHFAMAYLPHLEVIPHSPIDTRTFNELDSHHASVPVTERLRPPIA